MIDLPINAVLPELIGALSANNSAVLIAPPGAGKTTAIAPALLDEDWCDGQIIITSPRRVAARAAAERMAENLGEKVGQRVGYLTRMDSKTSKDTRILVVTEAILVNRLLEDQELDGVSALLFDEAHERHLDSDLGLALALETQGILREDLRICVMSATIDGARFARLLGDDAPVVESEGKAYPLEINWLGASPEKRLDEAMASAVLTAWRQEEGDVLAFLPGVGEIERVRERLEKRLPNALILPLHGQVQPQDQRAAIKRDTQGRRRIVLATSIAESSITLDGVSVVVDSGITRSAEFDRAAGVTHLITHRSSQASSAQRAGRAARQGPGIAYRLWEKGGHAGRPEFDAPEVEVADLAPLVLSLARAGYAKPDELAWLDTPPPASIASARDRLTKLGALDGEGRLTDWGGKIAQMPMDPAGGAAILFGAKHGEARVAARLVLLLQERGLGGRSEDLSQRLSRWNSDKGRRADASRKLADGWARMAGKIVKPEQGSDGDPALFLGLAMPDNIARPRDKSGEVWVSAGGRGYSLDPSSPLARAEWLVIGDAQGRASGARITAALPVEPAEIEQWFGTLIERRQKLNWNEKEQRIEARLEKRLGAIKLASGPDSDPDPAMLADKLVEKAVENLGALLPPNLLARAKYAGIDGFDEQALASRADEWLAPLLSGRRDLKLPVGKFGEAALNLLDWNGQQELSRLSPREFTSPANTTHKIDYTKDSGPQVEVRVQALFGLDQHPMIGSGANTAPLLLQLTSPAGRAIQAVRDLPGFWRGTWKDMCKDMKGRYPRHRWPEEPWNERPSLKTKNAFNRGAAKDGA